MDMEWIQAKREKTFLRGDYDRLHYEEKIYESRAGH